MQLAVAAALSLAISARALQAASVSGTIVIERKLTKRTVTPAVGLYQRGSAVALKDDAAQDPLDYERSHVAVYLEDGSGASSATASIEQRDRRFIPDLVAIPLGSSVSFPNFDPIFHNVFSLSKPKSFDLGNYSKGQTRIVTFPKTGLVFVYCHLHPNMAATIVVTPNRWNTIADAAGNFTISEVPPGSHTIVAWHKSGGTFRQKVDVTPQGRTDVKFFIPLPEGPAPPIRAAAHH
jgi:plastocyanin